MELVFADYEGEFRADGVGLLELLAEGGGFEGIVYPEAEAAHVGNDFERGGAYCVGAYDDVGVRSIAYGAALADEL